MDVIDSAGKQVLLSYGQFLDTVGIHLYHMKESLESFPESMTAPVKIEIIYKEHCPLYERVLTDNSIHNKVLVTFTAVHMEIENLKEEFLNKYVHRILNYGEVNGEGMSNNEVCVSACQLVPTLTDIINFARRCRQVLNHVLEQILGVQQYPWIKSQSHLSSIFWMLGELALILVALDELFNYDRENTIERHMMILTDKIKRIVDNDSTHRLSPLINLMNQIRSELLSSSIFQDSLHISLEKKSSTNMESVIEQINAYFKQQLVELETSKENDIMASHSWSNLVALYGLAVNTLGVADKKILKGFQDLSKKFLVSCMFGEVMWMPGKFLSRQLTLKMRDIAPKLPSANNSLLIKALEQEESMLAKDLKHYAFLVHKWALQMENIMSRDTTCQKWNGIESALICLEGADLCDSLKQTVSRLRYYHSVLGRPMVKQAALHLCKLVQLTMAVVGVFSRHDASMAKQANHIIEQLAAHSLVVVINAKKDAGKSRNMDNYSLLSIAEEVLYRGCTKETLCLANLATTIVGQRIAPLNLLTRLAEFKSRYDNLLFGSLSHKQMLLLHLSHRINSDAIKYATIQHVLNSSPYLDHNDDEGSDEFKSDSGAAGTSVDKDYVYSLLRAELCEPVETWLRLAAHCHLRKDSTVVAIDHPDFRSIMQMPPLLLSHYFISIKGIVECYLDSTFYDMSTVAQHDWQSYREMRSLAEHKLGLCTVDDHLPSQTLSQSMDLVDIVRNIDTFVTKFSYNLNSQFFVERSSNNKHLNTITVDHVSNSIATHGTGIINTTTNYIYQFIKKKLVVLSQLIYDEKVSCRLSKERDQFLEAKQKRMEITYPYDRADKLNKQVGRIGVGPDGLDLLDKCITVITQIGNAVGLVRMVRSGGLHQCLKTSEYISEAEVNLNLNSENGDNSVDSLMSIVDNINHNLNEGHEYLKLLVEAFSDVCISKENGHLKLLAILIPILSISYVQYMITVKEKTSKRNRDTVVFTDDGLPVGVTYLLRVLNLEAEFDSLRWFDSVSKKFFEQEQTLTQSNVSSDDNTNKLAIRRLKMYQKEFELLYCSLISARVFF